MNKTRTIPEQEGLSKNNKFVYQSNEPNFLLRRRFYQGSILGKYNYLKTAKQQTMKKIRLIFLLYGIVAWSSMNAQTRVLQDFNSSWKFCACDATGTQAVGFNDAAWGGVTTPHTWNNMDGQDGGNNYYRGAGWYRKHFAVDNAMTGKRVFLKFNAANLQTDVYVNGSYVGQHIGGYSAFVFDVTSFVNSPGTDNVLAVKVNNIDTIKAAPLDADFTFFGGLTKSVEILYTDPIHITPLDFGSPGVYITQKNVSATNADIYLKALVKNDKATAAMVTVNYLISDASGTVIKTLTSTASLAAGAQANYASSASISNPILWNGLTNPYLYSVKTQVSVGGSVIDEVVQPLGIRFYSVDANNGFFLNGTSYHLHGVAHHEDRVDKGRAISDQDRKQDLDILKELGCNYLRLSHYQHGQYTYDYCDANGIVTWTEIPLIDKVDASVAFSNNAKLQLTELMLQNYNHPSVVVWGLSNEITYKGGPDPSPLVQQLNTLAQQIDSTRLTASAAMHTNAPLNFYSDVYSCNVYNGWYYNTYNDFGTWANTQHSAHPANILGVSEYGAGANVTQHEPLNPVEPLNYGPWHPEEYQALFHEAHWQQMVARPYLWSTSVWVGFDFASDGRNEGQQPGINDKGLVTRDRLVKKDAFYYYKANWSSDPFVYITSRRFTVRYDSVLTAKVYSNCDSVKMKINTIQLATKVSTTHIYSWTNATLVRGTNTITVIAYKNGVPYYDTCYWQFNGPYQIVVPPAALQINFETPATVTPAGYLKDAGNNYADRGNGYTYGWNQSITANARLRTTEPLVTFNSFMQMQYNNGYNFWEIALPEGMYRVSIVAGDPDYFDSFNAISAENKIIVKEAVYSSKRHAYGSDTVYVSDGKLTIKPATGSGATNSKINFIHIEPVSLVTDAEDPQAATSIIVFPNPTTAELTLSPIKEEVSIRLTDAIGNLVHLYSNVQPGSFTLSTGELKKGIYLIEVNGKTSHFITKVVVE